MQVPQGPSRAFAPMGTPWGKATIYCMGLSRPRPWPAVAASQPQVVSHLVFNRIQTPGQNIKTILFPPPWMGPWFCRRGMWGRGAATLASPVRIERRPRHQCAPVLQKHCSVLRMLFIFLHPCPSALVSFCPSHDAPAPPPQQPDLSQASVQFDICVCCLFSCTPAHQPWFLVPFP